jgi:hypothetical protein
MLAKSPTLCRSLVALFRARNIELCMLSGMGKFRPVTSTRLSLTFVWIFVFTLQPTMVRSEGAFAFLEYGNGLWTSSVAYNSPTKVGAARQAIERCSRNGESCSIRTTFRNTCFAVAIQDTTSTYTWSEGGNIDFAQREALRKCTRFGASCSIKHAICDTIEQTTRQSDGQDNARLLAIFDTMQLFAIAALFILWGSMFASVLLQHKPESLAVAPLFSGLDVLGLLIGIAHHQGLLSNYDVLLVQLGLICLTSGNILIICLLGVFCVKLEEAYSLRLAAVFFAAAATGTAFVLYAHYSSRLPYADPILIGTTFSWVFVFGYVINDPVIAPALRELNKIIEALRKWTRQLRFFFKRLLISLESTTYEALQSIYESINDPVIAPAVRKLDKIIAVLRTWPRLLLLFFKPLLISAVSTTYKALRSIYESVTARREAAPRRNLPAVLQVPSHSLDVLIAPSGQRMQLKLKRSQRSGFTGKVIFVVDARMEVSAEEYDLIQRYKLGDDVIYDSSARQQHTEAMKEHVKRSQEGPRFRDSVDGQLMSLGKQFYRLARAGVSATRASLSLRITVYSLMKGVHVECKSMAELLGAEQAIVEAGEKLRVYLDTAATFDGREEVHEF